MDMLEQTNPIESNPLDPLAAPLSVSAPRAAAVPRSSPGRQSDRLGEMIARAETLLLHLESRLHEERSASDRAVRVAGELEERLRLGVRMLQAVDLQVERGARTADQASDAAARAEATVSSRIDEVVQERLRKFDGEIAWRFDRVKEVEERIEQAANGKLAWLDAELAERLNQMSDACGRVEKAAKHAEEVAERLAPLAESTERADRVREALEMANGESARLVEALSQRSCDAVALREALGSLTHELHAAREVVAGEMRRMRDDLFWLTERGERIAGELVERADSGTIVSQALRVQAEAAAPLLGELAEWMPLLSGDSRERVRPVADAIATQVREALTMDMHGFTLALRQLADRAERSFAEVRLERALAPSGREPAEAFDPRSAARVFATELSRLGTSPSAPSDSVVEGMAARSTGSSVISANRPIEISV